VLCLNKTFICWRDIKQFYYVSLRGFVLPETKGAQNKYI